MALFVRRRWPWAVAAVGVLVVVAVALVLLTRGGGSRSSNGEATGSGTADPDAVATEEPAPDATLPGSPLQALLAAPDGRVRTFVDTEVAADGVAVQSVVGPDSLWIGDSVANRVLVVLVSTQASFAVRPGDRVSFTGTVRPLTPDFARLLGAKGADLAELTRQAAYVEITEYRGA